MFFSVSSYETDNKPKSVCFVDWAVTSWNNPALDLTNFMMTSANPDVLNNHFPELMQIYHSILMTSLEKVRLLLAFLFFMAMSKLEMIILLK